MVLREQGSASHNQMLGQKIRHPASTNYDDDYVTPDPKRLKRLDNTDSSLSRRGSDEEDGGTPISPMVRSNEIADSEAEDGEDDLIFPGSQTELESALPPVKTDKEAIAEYEAIRAAESTDLDLHERLGQRKWISGK
ncbi:MAG: hypothetical protein Q9214_001184, partial [Letrouitia sp. 1 TL-2023]